MCNNLTLLNFDRVAQGVEPCSTTFDNNRVTILEPAVSSEAAFIFVRASPPVRVPTRVNPIYTGRKKNREPPSRVGDPCPDTGGVKSLPSRVKTIEIHGV